MSQQLSAEDPQNIEIVSDVANCHFKLAQVLDTRDSEAALGHATKSISLLDGLLRRSQDSNLAGMRIRAEIAAGGIEMRMDRASAALINYRLAGKAAAEMVGSESGQAGAQTELARSQTGAADANARLGRWSEALADYRSAQKNWSELSARNPLSPEDAPEPRRIAARMVRGPR